jgi:peptidoglycan/xylan/chitin deacetylase (PgdA/CDA1 family)
MTPFENIKNKILLTFDIEDGISLSMRDNFNTLIPQTNRVVIYTELILGILAEYDVKSTFFILGQVAEKFPSLIKTISNEGHELAVHGYDHFTLNKLNPKKALQEVTRAKKLIEDISGLEVYGHRAPAFSLTEKTSWMFDVLVEAGFMYEISTWEIGGFSVPYSGGGYLRLIPEFLLKRLFVKELKRDHVIHYMHPYEIDQERYPDYYFEALANSSLKKSLKMRSYWLNRSSLPSKLRMLSENFQSAKIIDLVNGVDSKPVVKL